MAIQDMNICLNVTNETANSQRQTSQCDNKDDAKTIGNKGVFVKKFKARANPVSAKRTDTKTKQRIKQKSLAAIVRNNLKKCQQLNEQQSPNLAVTAKLEPSTKTRQVDNLVNKEKESKSVLHSQNSDSHIEPLIKFIKSTKSSTVVVARKKKNADLSNKKSLADIFSTSKNSTKGVLEEYNEASLIKDVNVAAHTVLNKKRKITVDKKSEKKSSPNVQKRKIKFDQSKDNDVKHRTSGYKISSLFGHNPEIPNIGQRFVKPINEEVFAATKFSDLHIHPYMVSNLEQNMQIIKMTTVQKKAIPIIMSRKDVLIRSQTGSGKTLAYAIPIVECLHKVRPKLTRSSGLKALIVVPTRELALQTYECFLKLIKPFTWIVPGYLFGGEKRKAEKARLRRGCNILVATPGRLLDHLKHTEALKLNEVKYFVLDEADRMLDMGYEQHISGIVSALKVASSDPKETGYDALGILRQNIKKRFSDNIVHQGDFKKDVSVYNDQQGEKYKEIDVNESKTKRYVYHSDMDSDSDIEDKELIKSYKHNIQTIEKKNKNIIENINVQKATESETGDLLRRQTILLSATLTQNVEKLAGITMHEPIFVDAAKENLESVTDNMSELNEDLVVPQSVIQSYVITPPKLRMVTLCAYIAGKCQSTGQHKVLIFMATQDMIDYHVNIMSNVLNKPVDEENEDSEPLVDVEFFKLHGSMTQKERTEVFKTFRTSKSGVLFCTDVAARGLDLPKVDTVIQYTGPLSARDYVHRIGRTARAGSSGSAILFLTPPEVEFVRMLESRRIRIKQDDMNSILDKLIGPLTKHNNAQAAAIALQNEFETMVVDDKKLHSLACKAYSSWVRFYTSYPRDMRHIFNRKNLHLGHYAKSFALRDPPQKIGSISKTIRDANETKPNHNNRLHNERPDGMSAEKRQNAGGAHADRRGGMLKKVRMLNMSEYDNGLEPPKKVAKRT